MARVSRFGRWVPSVAVLSVISAAGLWVAMDPALAVASNLSQKADTTFQTNGRVDTILMMGNSVYVGGQFTSVRPSGSPVGTGEVARNHLAAFDRASGAVL